MNNNEKKHLILFILLTALLFNVWTLPRYREFKQALESLKTMSNTIQDSTHKLHRDYNSEWRADQLASKLRQQIKNQIRYTVNQNQIVTFEIMDTSEIKIVSNSLNLFTEYDFIIKELNFITTNKIPKIEIVLETFLPLSI